MKRFLAVALAALVVVPNASAAPSPAQLQRQITTLKTQVSQLRSRVSRLEADLADTQQGLELTINLTVCGQALLWDSVNLIVTTLGGVPGEPFDDRGTCAALGITRRSTRTGLAALASPVVPRGLLSAAAQRALR